MWSTNPSGAPYAGGYHLLVRQVSKLLCGFLQSYGCPLAACHKPLTLCFLRPSPWLVDSHHNKPSTGNNLRCSQSYVKAIGSTIFCFSPPHAWKSPCSSTRYVCAEDISRFHIFQQLSHMLPITLSSIRGRFQSSNLFPQTRSPRLKKASFGISVTHVRTATVPSSLWRNNVLGMFVQILVCPEVRPRPPTFLSSSSSGPSISFWPQ